MTESNDLLSYLLSHLTTDHIKSAIGCEIEDFLRKVKVVVDLNPEVVAPLVDCLGSAGESDDPTLIYYYQGMLVMLIALYEADCNIRSDAGTEH